MRNGVRTAIVAGCMMAAMSLTSYAAEWKQDQVGWWYQNDDGSYAKDGWSWIDGRCYYFDGSGYCLLNTTTPDGYTVDASGAWTVDGVVQTQAAETQTAQDDKTVINVGGMSITVPDGFWLNDMMADNEGAFLVSDDEDVAIAVMSSEIPGIQGNEELVAAMSEPILDSSISAIGTVVEKSTSSLNSGLWYRYRMSDEDAAAMGIPGQMYAYLRIDGISVQLVMFAGNLSDVDMDAIMNSCIR